MLKEREIPIIPDGDEADHQETPETISANDMAKILGLKKTEDLYAMIREGKLTGGNKNGRYWAFTQENLMHFEQQLKDLGYTKIHDGSLILSSVTAESLEREPQEEQQLIFASPPSFHREERVLQQVETMHTLDPIEQAIKLLQQSKQQEFECQQMIQDVRAMRAQLGSLLNTMDEFLEQHS